MNEQDFISIIEDEPEVLISELPLPSAKNDFDAYLTILHDLRRTLDENDEPAAAAVQAAPQFAPPDEVFEVEAENLSPLEIEVTDDFEIEPADAAEPIPETVFAENDEENRFAAEPIFNFVPEAESLDLGQESPFSEKFNSPEMTAEIFAEIAELDFWQNQSAMEFVESENDFADFADLSEANLSGATVEELIESANLESIQAVQSRIEIDESAAETSIPFSFLREETSEETSFEEGEPEFKSNLQLSSQSVEFFAELPDFIEADKSLDEIPIPEIQMKGDDAGETTQIGGEFEPQFEDFSAESSFEMQPEFESSELESENGFRIVADDFEPEEARARFTAENFTGTPVFKSEIAGSLPEAQSLFETAAGEREISVPVEVNERDRYVVFKLDEGLYAFPADNVAEISYPLAVTNLPFVPAWVAGVTNLRGDIVAVVDLRRLWDKPAAALDAKTKMLVVSSAAENLRVCLIVDEVHEIRLFSETEISAGFAAPFAPYLKGIASYEGNAMCVINAEQFLSSPRLRQF